MTRRRALWLLGIASLVLLIALALIDRRMQDAGGPGIIGFELARTPHRVAEILREWGADGQDAARLSLWLDYLYLIAYGLFFRLAVLALGDALARCGVERLARPARALALVPLVVAASDALEDLFLLLVLGGYAPSVGPRLATGFATLKFLGLAVTLAYLLAGLVTLLVRRGRAAPAR